MAKKRVGFMLTAFRDGFQSVFGARVLSKDFLPVVRAAAAAGISHFESGGGAMFQSPVFYCNESPFAVMDAFRAAAGPEARLQTLARGVNVVGLDSQPADVIDLHARLFKKHGVTTIRNFDALNDVRNLIDSGRSIVAAGLEHEVCVTLMALPPGCEGAHTPEFYSDVLQRIIAAEIPFSSVCFKDASGTATPETVHETIARARRLLPGDTRIVFHSHDTAGGCVAAYLAALQGGADQLDLSIAPCSGGTCQPDLLTMWHALRGSEFELELDPTRILELERLFEEALADYFLPPEATRVEPRIPFFPMPGGALTANTQMLRDNGLMHRYPEVIAAMGDVVAKGGFGTSVTPVSQFYFQQAFNNVMFGPWQKIAEGYGKMVLGYFGRTPVAPDPAVVRAAREQLHLEPTHEPPLQLDQSNPAKGLGAARRVLVEQGLPVDDESLFLVATCKDRGVAFLQGKGKLGVRRKEAAPADAPADTASAPNANDRYTVTVHGTAYSVRLLSEHTAEVDGETFTFDLSAAPVLAAPTSLGTAPMTVAPVAEGALREVRSPLPGVVVRAVLRPGCIVRAGETLLLLESMKMETAIVAPVSGQLASLQVQQGDRVQASQLLATIQEAPLPSPGRA